MTARDDYEQHQAAQVIVNLRKRLHDTYMDYAEQARKDHRWSAAQAYETAAGLALGMAVRLGDEPHNRSLRGAQDPSSRGTMGQSDAPLRVSG